MYFKDLLFTQGLKASSRRGPAKHSATDVGWLRVASAIVSVSSRSRASPHPSRWGVDAMSFAFLNSMSVAAFWKK